MIILKNPGKVTISNIEYKLTYSNMSGIACGICNREVRKLCKGFLFRSRFTFCKKFNIKGNWYFKKI